MRIGGGKRKCGGWKEERDEEVTGRRRKLEKDAQERKIIGGGEKDGKLVEGKRKMWRTERGKAGRELGGWMKKRRPGGG